MNSTPFSSIILAAILCIQFFQLTVYGSDASNKLYIVYLGEIRHNDPKLVTASHHEMLTPLFESKVEAVNSIIYSYKHAFSGFAALLNESQAQILSEMPDVTSVTPNRMFTVHTTHSWDFLGLNYNSKDNTLLQKANYGEDIIIGVIDTGISPESKSFDATGFGTAPKRWRGICQTGTSFGAMNCSNKIIGARWYAKDLTSSQLKGDYLSPRDYNGHGTHCASTAAGNVVLNVSFHSLAAGSVRGGAPRARIAVYKVCWGARPSCSSAGIVAAVDDAVHDGVDVLSLSLALSDELTGALHAVAKGISVVFAAGNSGPAPRSVSNNSPWLISVAASTMDRSFPTVITLGNRQKFVGQSLFYASGKSKHNNFNNLVIGGSCDNTTLTELDVTGMIVLCYDPTAVAQTSHQSNYAIAVQNVRIAGGRGVIYPQYTLNILEPLDGFPYALVDFEIAKKIVSYVDSTRNPLVKISPAYSIQGEQVLAPKIAAFSSRGPNPTFPGILKPDISAPGVSILAAVPEGYGFDSGTSMACPHVSGIVALLKSVHPDWSPSAIKSAIVTTASVADAYGVPIEAEATPRKLADPFDYGGGHIDPNKAADPGLVYDIHPKDYTKFFKCTLGPSDNCDTSVGQLYQLNVPSIAVPDLKNITSVFRTVTNVGPTYSTYKAFVQPPAGVTVFVEPNLICFDSSKKVETFKVTFVANRKVQGDYTFGSLIWSDSLQHSVRIPIAVRTIIEDNYADTA
ncbi:subtilisin-like protease SBT3.10 [Carex rostrata]